MDQQTRDNWIRIKEALEVAGKTDCYFYKRAVVIVKGGRDPMEHPFGEQNKNGSFG